MRLMVAGILLLCSAMPGAAPVKVRHTEGLVHGFLVLSTLEGGRLADGDLIQTARGTRVTSRLTFRFPDGSVHDETTVFSQHGEFRLISDRLVQKGPAFPHPLEMSIDAGGVVTVNHVDDEGKQRQETEHLDLPPDLANGLIPTLLKNVGGSPPESLSFVAATPKPRLVKLQVTSAGMDGFSTGGHRRTATHYVLKVDIGGIQGVLAPLLGKQPPDSHVWILGGDAPAFVKAEQQLYLGGPVWRIELESPVWTATPRR
jgi:hypothetical protein